MDKEYTIERLSDSRLLILSTSYESPLCYAGDLEKDLIGMNFAGMIVFDQLLCNGADCNRFVELAFDLENGKINYDSVKIVTEIDDSILDVSRQYYRSSWSRLSNDDVLLESQRRAILD